MLKTGAGICPLCMEIGPFDEWCTQCDWGARCVHQDEVLGKENGVCFSYHCVGPYQIICECSHGIYSRIREEYIPIKEHELKSEQQKAIHAGRNKDMPDMAMCTKEITQLSGDYNNDKAWLLDSGAKTHVTNDLRNFAKSWDVLRSNKVGNGQVIKTTKTGIVRSQVNPGEWMVLTDVLYAEWFAKNNFSIHKMAMKGISTLLCPEHVIFKNAKTRKEVKVKSDITTGLWHIKPVENVQKCYTGGKINYMDINEAHRKLRHPSETTTRLTVESYEGWEVSGKIKPCVHCYQGKGKAKGVSHKPSTQSEKPGEGIFLDTTGPYLASAGGFKYDINLVDQFSKKKWMAFAQTKDEVSLNT
jgi:hypothetical protein